MKKIGIISILSLLAVFCYSKKSTFDEKRQFNGKWKWEKNDDKHQFSIEINYIDGFLVGKHCYIINNGANIDCSYETNEFSFKVKDNGKLYFITEVKSFNSGAIGIIKIELINNKLIWKLIKKPSDVYYFPLEAVLVKL